MPQSARRIGARRARFGKLTETRQAATPVSSPGIGELVLPGGGGKVCGQWRNARVQIRDAMNGIGLSRHTGPLDN